jgi:hypothetical protein
LDDSKRSRVEEKLGHNFVFEILMSWIMMFVQQKPCTHPINVLFWWVGGRGKTASSERREKRRSASREKTSSCPCPACEPRPLSLSH